MWPFVLCTGIFTPLVPAYWELEKGFCGFTPGSLGGSEAMFVIGGCPYILLGCIWFHMYMHLMVYMLLIKWGFLYPVFKGKRYGCSWWYKLA